MCNELDQQVRQMTQRSAKGVVDALCAGVGHNLGGQTRQQSSQRLRTMTLQREEVLELADHPFDDLQIIEGVIGQLKDFFSLERHRAKTLGGLLTRLAAKVVAYTCAQRINDTLNRPLRHLADLLV